MFLQTFLEVSIVFNTFMLFIWTTTNWLNVIIKLVFGALTASAVFLLLQQLGYIVKV